MINRIIKSFLKEWKDYPYQGRDYEISGMWQDERLRASELWDAIIKNDIQKVERMLSDFAQQKFTTGLSLIGDGQHNYKEQEIKENYIDWKKLTFLPDKILEYPNKFGFERTPINGIMIIPSAMRLSYYAKRIIDLVDGNVVEIGGGFGGVAYHLFRDFHFKHTYINCDIFISLLITKYFLMSIFPDKKFLLYGENDIKNFKKYDIVLLPHFAIQKLPKGCCKIIFNSHSLSEIGKDTIAEYLRQITRISPEYFLHLNHDCQAYFTDRPITRGVDRGHLVNLSEPKWEAIGYKRIYRLFEPLMRQEAIDYFEYLYEKNNRRPL